MVKNDEGLLHKIYKTREKSVCWFYVLVFLSVFYLLICKAFNITITTSAVSPIAYLI